jgi:hypothetical protein
MMLLMMLIVSCGYIQPSKVGRVYRKCNGMIRYHYTVKFDSTAITDTLYIVARDTINRRDTVMHRIPIWE